MATYRQRIAAGLFALFVATAAANGRAATAEVRPLSDAERSAAQIAAAYLSRGPAAVADQLSSDSPLRQLRSDDGLTEIEVRLGPPAGAVWQMQTVVPALKDKTAAFTIEFPSGTDDATFFDLVKEGDAYKIRDIRMLAQRSPKPQLFPPLPPTPATPARRELPVRPIALALGLAGAAIAMSAAFVRRYSATASRSMVAGSLVLVIGGTVFAVLLDSRFKPKVVEARRQIATVSYTRLGSLLALRRAITSGAADVDALFAGVPSRGEAHDVATAWKAQAALQLMKRDEARRILGTFESPSDIPLVEILRARVSMSDGDEVSSILAYEHALNLGPGRDGLWLETAQALLGLGYEERAARYFERLTQMGSRTPDVYYTLAVYQAWNGKEDEAERLLLRAWSLRPAERSDLIEAGALWSVLRRDGTAKTISLSVPEEATVSVPRDPQRFITLPPDAQPRVSGEFLDVQIGEQELQIPGGASSAGPTAPVVDAGAFARLQEEQALRDFTALSAINHSAAVAQPSLRRRMIRTANALEHHNRWADLLQLTDGLSPAVESVPPQLIFLRAQALERVSRLADAKSLVAELAASRVLQRRKDAQALIQLGETLASFDMFDPAVKMYDRAQTIRPNASIDERVRQIQMNKRLATSYQTATTPHFEIHYPPDLSPTAATQIGNILESEYKRLQAWVPTPDFKTTVVNIVWWGDFRSTYTGSDFILGFYRGSITLPFAGVQEYVPPVVGILSHELCHALIGNATNEQTPRWFHEGLAQRIEMRPFHANAFNMYDDSRLLAVSLLDAVMIASPDPDMISEAYIESQTVIRYIEATYGTAGITKMIRAFHDGATTEQAIAQLTGGSVADFDARLRAWGRSGAKVFENPSPVRYDVSNEEDIRWARPAAKRN